MPSACDVLPNETSQEIAPKKSKQKDKKNGSVTTENGHLNDESNSVDKNGSTSATTDSSKVAVEQAPASPTDKAKNDQELIFIHDTGFTIKVAAPGVETFDLQVSSLELVQEIHHLLMDREDTCSRTCFSLSLNGNTLDNFTELKSIEGFKEGAFSSLADKCLLHKSDHF